MEAKRKGSMSLVICSSFISPMAQAMKRHTPTGGGGKADHQIEYQYNAKMQGVYLISRYTSRLMIRA